MLIYTQNSSRLTRKANNVCLWEELGDQGIRGWKGKVTFRYFCLNFSTVWVTYYKKQKKHSGSLYYFLLSLQIVKSFLHFVKNEISGWGEVGTEQTLFQFSKLVSPNCTRRMDSQWSHLCANSAICRWESIVHIPLGQLFPSILRQKYHFYSFLSPLKRSPWRFCF